METDGIERAILGLTAEVGNINGRMEGFGREFRDIKNLLKCKSEDCIACKKEIETEIDAQTVLLNDRITMQDEKFKPIENLHTGEKAVRSWKDKTLGEVGVTIGAISGIIALLAYVIRGLITGDWI